MADERQRDLERQLRQRSSSEARARLLQERRRTGVLSSALLDLAAICGDKDAIVLSSHSPLPIEAVLERVATLHAPAAVIGAVAAFDHVYPKLPTCEESLVELARAAKDCLIRPSGSSARRAVVEADRLPSIDELVHRATKWAEVGHYARSDLEGLRVALSLPEEAARGAAHLALRRRYPSFRFDSLKEVRRIGDSFLAEMADLEEAIRLAICTWAIGM